MKIKIPAKAKKKLTSLKKKAVSLWKDKKNRKYILLVVGIVVIYLLIKSRSTTTTTTTTNPGGSSGTKTDTGGTTVVIPPVTGGSGVTQAAYATPVTGTLTKIVYSPVESINIIGTPIEGGFSLSDMANAPKGSNYDYYYTINNGEIIFRGNTELRDFVYQTKNPILITKFKIRKDLDNMNHWGTGEQEYGGYYQMDAGETFPNNASCVFCQLMIL